MLKENKIGQTVSLKLTSGDEVVGKIVGQNAEGITLSQPVILAASHQGLAMVPFMMTADPGGEFLFRTANIMCMVDTNQQVADAYLTNTTGIQPVRNSSLIVS